MRPSRRVGTYLLRIYVIKCDIVPFIFTVFFFSIFYIYLKLVVFLSVNDSIRYTPVCRVQIINTELSIGIHCGLCARSRTDPASSERRIPRAVPVRVRGRIIIIILYSPTSSGEGRVNVRDDEGGRPACAARRVLRT